MGRCNNRRVQQQAQDTRNVPSRARFSKPPAFLVNKGRKKRNGTSNASAAPSVAERVASRIHQNHHDAASRVRVTRRNHEPVVKPFKGNVNSLDVIELSDESVERIFQVLSSLGVIQSYQQQQESRNSQALMDDGDFNGQEGDGSDSNDDNDEFDGDRAYNTGKRRGVLGLANEYDDDYDDQPIDATVMPKVSEDRENHVAEDGCGPDWIDAEWEGGGSNQPPHSQLGTATKRNAADGINLGLVEKDPVFRYLTTHLSFSKIDAYRACTALESWQGATATKPATTNSSTNASSNSSSNGNNQVADWKDRLTLAMDWLALHLKDAAIVAGFRRNPNRAPEHAIPTKTYTAVSHPSLSLATKLTDDADFLRQARVEELSLKFVQLGFPYADVVGALEQQPERLSKPEKMPKDAPALDDDVTLRLLLGKIEKDTLLRDHPELLPPRDAGDTLQVDDAALVEERAQEIEVLSAVYDADFQVVDANGCDPRYKIILPADVAAMLTTPSATTTDMNSTNDAEGSAELHVFLRPGYPALAAPLFMVAVRGSHVDPPLLRRINQSLVGHAGSLVGGPCVFEVTSFLVESVHDIAGDFHKERRAKEFEEQQLRMRLEADAALWKEPASAVVDSHDDNDDERAKKLGRRQVAKLKAEERSHDFAQKQEMLEASRREKQLARLERIKEKDQFVRQARADELVERREHERHQEALQKASRAAMLAALNAGASSEEARACAERAKRAYLREHGLLDGESENGESESGDSAPDNDDSSQNESAASSDDREATTPAVAPNTNAFMERLRALYSSAAEQKGIVHLSSPNESDRTRERLPCPIAVPIGDLASVITDVVSVQREQPWLLNREEARVPTFETIAATDASERDVSQAHRDPDGLSVRLKAELESKQSLKKYQSILKQRQKLPAFQAREELESTIANNQVTVVWGETGCGKSICTPQLVLDDMIRRNLGSHANIIVTQPRRISAVGVAERIAFERLEPVGESCGYSIKLEKKTSARTRILLCTTGILLRRLQCDPDLASVSHVFVDEVHERDLNTDFILIILKELLKRRPSLKLVLMSATLNAESFVRYFPGSATVSIPGRSHPVQEYRLEDILQQTGYEVRESSDYARKGNSKGPRLTKKQLRAMYPNFKKEVINSLEIVDESIINYELLAQLLLHIVDNFEDGAVLVFLPGIMEISKAMDEIRRIEKFQTSAYRIYPLHSSLSTADQVAMFEVPPPGVRKIVLSTNIAETSITIEDVVFVVDSGRVKENRRDEVKETPTLVECWVSRASAKQRRGRAGRVRPGVAYHMYSSYTHDTVLLEHQLPEILRVGLEDIVLQILTLDLGEPCKFLSSAIDPPSALAMKNALGLLESLGAVECAWRDSPGMNEGASSQLETARCGVLDASTELTALGFHLSSLPVDPRVGKMMIYGTLFGCVDSALTIAAAMTSTKSLFVSPFDQREAANEAHRALSVEGSDHMTHLFAFNEWKRLRKVKGGKAAQTFANDNFLSRTTLYQMEDLRRHYASLLVEIGFLPRGFKLQDEERRSSSETATSQSSALLRALLCAGLYPNVIVSPRTLLSTGNKEAGEVAFTSRNKGDVYLHPCTVSYSATKLTSRYHCYYEVVRTSKMFVRDLTPVSPLALLLFGGVIETFPTEGVITVDEWLPFRISSKGTNSSSAPARRLALIKHLRFQLESILLQKIVSPISEAANSAEILDAIVLLLNEQDQVTEGTSNAAEVVRPYVLPNGEARGGRGGMGDGRKIHSGRGRGRGRGRSNNRGLAG